MHATVHPPPSPSGPPTASSHPFFVDPFSPLVIVVHVDDRTRACRMSIVSLSLSPPLPILPLLRVVLFPPLLFPSVFRAPALPRRVTGLDSFPIYDRGRRKAEL